MLIRCLIVLLVVLNMGVAGWWIFRPAVPPAAPVPQPEGVARLQLLSEAPLPAAPAPVATPAPVPASPPPAPATAPVAQAEAPKPEPKPVPAEPKPQCFSLGPFADAAAARAATAAIKADSARARTREVKGAATAKGGYSVYLPSAGSPDEAQALAGRIREAGFDDLLVIREGEQANGIALGLYRSEEGAHRRQAALKAAGFAARIREPVDAAPSQWWADIAARPGLDAARARSRTGAAGTQLLDCAALR